ncbi:hypothetical protein JCM10213_009118 [Rhodosporidiobolus nylandii]
MAVCSLSPWLARDFLSDRRVQGAHLNSEAASEDWTRGQIIRATGITKPDGEELVWTEMSDGEWWIDCCIPKRVVDEYEKSKSLVLGDLSRSKALLRLRKRRFILARPLLPDHRSPSKRSRDPVLKEPSVCLRVDEIQFFADGHERVTAVDGSGQVGRFRRDAPMEVREWVDRCERGEAQENEVEGQSTEKGKGKEVVYDGELLAPSHVRTHPALAVLPPKPAPSAGPFTSSVFAAPPARDPKRIRPPTDWSLAPKPQMTDRRIAAIENGKRLKAEKAAEAAAEKAEKEKKAAAEAAARAKEEEVPPVRRSMRRAASAARSTRSSPPLPPSSAALPPQKDALPPPPSRQPVRAAVDVEEESEEEVYEWPPTSEAGEEDVRDDVDADEEGEPEEKAQGDEDEEMRSPSSYVDDETDSDEEVATLLGTQPQSRPASVYAPSSPVKPTPPPSSAPAPPRRSTLSKTVSAASLLSRPAPTLPDKGDVFSASSSTSLPPAPPARSSATPQPDPQAPAAFAALDRTESIPFPFTTAAPSRPTPAFARLASEAKEEAEQGDATPRPSAPRGRRTPRASLQAVERGRRLSEVSGASASPAPAPAPVKQADAASVLKEKKRARKEAPAPQRDEKKPPAKRVTRATSAAPEPPAPVPAKRRKAAVETVEAERELSKKEERAQGTRAAAAGVAKAPPPAKSLPPAKKETKAEGKRRAPSAQAASPLPPHADPPRMDKQRQEAAIPPPSALFEMAAPPPEKRVGPPSSSSSHRRDINRSLAPPSQQTQRRKTAVAQAAAAQEKQQAGHEEQPAEVEESDVKKGKKRARSPSFTAAAPQRAGSSSRAASTAVPPAPTAPVPPASAPEGDPNALSVLLSHFAPGRTARQAQMRERRARETVEERDKWRKGVRELLRATWVEAEGA